MDEDARIDHHRSVIMDKFIEELINKELPWEQAPWFAWTILLGLIAILLGLLGKGADWLVDEAVALSERSGVPKIVIGATIVSVGTTAPEVAISVFAALQGRPDVALGNAVGSVICDTGLILGLAALIAPLPLNKNIVNRQGWVQLGAGILLVICCTPWLALPTMFTQGGRLHQTTGFFFLVLLIGYLCQSIRWAKLETEVLSLEELETDVRSPTYVVFTKLIAALALVVVSAKILIPVATVAAQRMNIPPAVISATLIAFGTSLPELITAVTAARQGHGDLAVGNVVGADILNVFLVAGTSAAVTSGGLAAVPTFFRILFPGMLLLLIVFRTGIYLSGSYMKTRFGIVLLVSYVFVTIAQFFFG